MHGIQQCKILRQCKGCHQPKSTRHPKITDLVLNFLNQTHHHERHVLGANLSQDDCWDNDHVEAGGDTAQPKQVRAT